MRNVGFVILLHVYYEYLTLGRFGTSELSDVQNTSISQDNLAYQPHVIGTQRLGICTITPTIFRTVVDRTDENHVFPNVAKLLIGNKTEVSDVRSNESCPWYREWYKCL